jgi:alkylation response protein AidB-like acyl-CoA dehydrogenase
VIDGQKTWISAAHMADHILTFTRTDTTAGRHHGFTFLVVPTDAPGLEIRPIDTMDGHVVNDVFFTGVRVGADAVVGEDGMAWQQLTRGLAIERLIIAAMSLGCAERALEDTIAYVNEREQFGRTIGSFQAVKHLCADMLVRSEVARAAVHAAACLADAPDVVESEAAVAGCTPAQLVDRSVGGAKLLADEAALGNARSAIQVHGGMGFTWEVPLHLHLKRARVRSTTFGTPADHAAALAVCAGAHT